MAIKTRGTIIPRNPVARSPLMKKGGVHEKSKTAKRRQNNQALKAQLEDWREELEFERSLRSNSNAHFFKPYKPKITVLPLGNGIVNKVSSC